MYQFLWFFFCCCVAVQQVAGLFLVLQFRSEVCVLGWGCLALVLCFDEFFFGL
jgi:hypothetical protein